VTAASVGTLTGKTFTMLNDGQGSPLASLTAHVGYGALVGGLAAPGR
jgi:hypothetical protein